jgi:hypothetical protein
MTHEEKIVCVNLLLRPCRLPDHGKKGLTYIFDVFRPDSKKQEEMIEFDCLVGSASTFTEGEYRDDRWKWFTKILPHSPHLYPIVLNIFPGHHDISKEIYDAFGCQTPEHKQAKLLTLVAVFKKLKEMGKKVVVDWASEMDSSFFEAIEPDLHRPFLEACLEKEGLLLSKMSAKCRDDSDLLRKALVQNSDAWRHASERLQLSLDVVAAEFERRCTELMKCPTHGQEREKCVQRNALRTPLKER